MEKTKILGEVKMEKTNSLSSYSHMAEKLLEDTFGFYFYGIDNVDDEKMFFYDKHKEITLEIQNIGHKRKDKGFVFYYSVYLRAINEKRNYITEINVSTEDIWDIIEEAIDELKDMYDEYEKDLEYYYGNGY
jgi:hypothetical protein